LDARTLPGLHGSLEFAEAVDPRYFRETLQSPLGAGFSIAPLLSQSAWFRFHNKADRVSNLYLCGAGVHPGGGLPGVVTSAKLVERLVWEDLRAGRAPLSPGAPLFEEAA
jgi:phytoene desaturase